MLFVLYLLILHDEVADLSSNFCCGFGLTVILFKVHPDHISLIHGNLSGHYALEILIFAILLIASAVSVIKMIVDSLQASKKLLHRILLIFLLLLDIDELLLIFPRRPGHIRVLARPLPAPVSASLPSCNRRPIGNHYVLFRYVSILEALLIDHLALSVDHTLPLLLILVDQVLDLELYSRGKYL
jgi:hypothetical protein